MFGARGIRGIRAFQSSSHFKDCSKLHLRRAYHQKLKVFLDLDDCLINANYIWSYETVESVKESWNKIGIDCGYIALQDSESDSPSYYSIAYRPGLFTFLEEANKIADLYVFSAGTQDYVAAIVKNLDPTGKYVRKYWSRDRVVWNRRSHSEYTKQLSLLDGHFDPNCSVLIDDRISNMIFQPHNGIVSCTSRIMQYGIREMSHVDATNPEFLSGYNPFPLILEDLNHMKNLRDIRPYLEEKYQILKQLQSYPLPPIWKEVIQSTESTLPPSKLIG